jgi:hypothetical protein
VDLLVLVVITVCFVLGARALGTRLGNGVNVTYGGLFQRAGGLGWPEGVQEADAPHFALDRWHGTGESEEPQLVSIDEPLDTLEELVPTAPHWRG